MFIKSRIFNFLICFCILSFLSLPAIAQELPDEFQNKKTDENLLARYLDKYGYKNHQLVLVEDSKVLLFKVQSTKTKEIYTFSIVFLPNGQLIKIQLDNFVTFPSDSKITSLLIDKLNSLNSLRTIGKYALNREKNKIRFFYYRTVVGGLSFADFKKTLEMIEFMVKKDRPEIQKIADGL